MSPCQTGARRSDQSRSVFAGDGANLQRIAIATSPAHKENYPIPSRSLASPTPGAGRPYSLAVTRASATSCRQRNAGRVDGKLLADGAIVLLGVERPVFADGVAQESVEHGPGD